MIMVFLPQDSLNVLMSFLHGFGQNHFRNDQFRVMPLHDFMRGHPVRFPDPMYEQSVFLREKRIIQLPP